MKKGVEILLKEVIVVEGKDDVSAVKKAFPEAQVIITNGLGITAEILAQIKKAQERCGVIILTDPDYPGEKIRKIITQTVPGCRHAYLFQEQEKKIGVEYASSEQIQQALEKARASVEKRPNLYDSIDLYFYGLAGNPLAAQRRLNVAKRLGLGQANAKQFLSYLNAYQIPREELESALKELGE